MYDIAHKTGPDKNIRVANGQTDRIPKQTNRGRVSDFCLCVTPVIDFEKEKTGNLIFNILYSGLFLFCPMRSLN
jgi:hypothetical protein